MRRRAPPWPTRLHRRTTSRLRPPPYPPRGKRVSGQHPRAARTPRRAPAPKRRSYMFDTA
jgi:hypothetical protein